jgi:exodeoxyribonuclease VII large subunit
MSEKQIFTLHQVVKSIKKTLEDRYAQTYWVKAEMHKLNRYPSGHAFPELVQKEEDKILAQITGTIWKQNLDRINSQFINVVKEPLKEGTTLLLLVKITFSETYGLSLQILDIDPSFSLGELQRQREETLKRLLKEGLLNLNQQLEFPLLPKRIAVISADSSKGLSDFMQVLEGSENGYTFFTHLFPAYLQGDVAVQSIINALEKIKKVKGYFDVVVIVRGGGAEVGMTCYNHYELCKAIAEFPLPILTGIGHSTNLNVAEMIAHRNEITPSKLAAFLIQTFSEFDTDVKNAQRMIFQYSKKVLHQVNHGFETQIRLFKQVASSYSKRVKQEIEAEQVNLQRNTKLLIKQQKEQLNYFQNEFGHVAKRNLTLNNNQLSHLTILVKPSVQRILEQKSKDLNQIEKTVRILSPENVLKRGYSITLFKGKTVSKTNLPSSNDEIETITLDKVMKSKIVEVESKSSN